MPSDRIELPTGGFSDQHFENSKTLYLQAFDSIPLFQLTFSFVWNCLEIFDLDGHNLGTIQLNYDPASETVLLGVKNINLRPKNVALFSIHP